MSQCVHYWVLCESVLQDGMISVISFQSRNFPEISLLHIIISKETRHKNQVLLEMNDMNC